MTPIDGEAARGAGDGEPGWRRGPDPDRPPWSSGDEDDVDEPAEREEQPDDRDAGGAGPVPSEDPGEGGDQSVQPEVMALAERMALAQQHMMTPPKRTGVFIDPDDLRAHVGDLLRTYLGGYQVDAWGNFTFTFEAARVFVTVTGSPIGPQVGVFSITNVDIELTPPLARFLLGINHKLGFGSFSYDEENQAIWLRHTLLGSTLDAPELQAAVAAVASTAAHFDDQIRDNFGGRAFHDVPEDQQQHAHPPEPSHEPPSVTGYL